MTLVELARQLRPIIEQAVSAALDDATALQSVPLFPAWAEGRSVQAGERYRHKNTLYRVLQPHTTQAGWEPDQAPALFAAVTLPTEGSKDHPIPAVRGMEYVYGLYYLENGTVYLCKRAGEAEGGKVILQYLPSELLGQYFELAE